MTSAIAEPKQPPWFKSILLLMKTTSVVIWLRCCLGSMHQDVAEVVRCLLDLSQLSVKVGLMSSDGSFKDGDLTVDLIFISKMSWIIGAHLEGSCWPLDLQRCHLEL